MKTLKGRKFNVMKWLLVPLVFIISCTIFGYEFGYENERPYFQWGIYHYLKKEGR